jgi:hypothetical protein
MHTRRQLPLVLKCLVLAPESMVRRVRVLRALLVGLALLTTEAKSPPLRRRLEQLDAALLPLGSSRFGVAPVPKFKSQFHQISHQHVQSKSQNHVKPPRPPIDIGFQKHVFLWRWTQL